MDHDTLLKRMGENLNVTRAFGPAYEHDGITIIPVAVIGGGGGGGSDPIKGEGGGFGGVAWPLGVYVIKDGTVRWRPAVDVTAVTLTIVGLVRTLIKKRRR